MTTLPSAAVADAQRPPDPTGALAAYEELLIKQPLVRFEGLWHKDGVFYAHCPDLDSNPLAHDGTHIVSWVASNLSVTARLDFAAEVPDGAERVHERSAREIASLTAEVPWLMDDLVSEFLLRVPRSFPPCEVAKGDGVLVLKTTRSLTDFESATAHSLLRSLGIVRAIEVVADPAFAPISEKTGGRMTLAPSRRLPSSFSRAVKSVYEAEEDFWLEIRQPLFSSLDVALGDILPERLGPGVSRCLLDARYGATANVRSFLPIYRQVILAMPFAKRYAETLATLRVTEDELIELARRGRVAFLAPQSLERYPPSLINKLVEAEPTSILFSRRLAAASVVETRRRLPPLFPALGALERRSLSQLLAAAALEVDERDATRLLRAILPTFQTNWTCAERLVHMTGAMASTWGALGSLMSALYKAASGKDRVIELGAAAGPVEWAGVLGASVHPPPMGGRSAEHATELCASLYSGARLNSPARSLGDVSPVLDGLLALDGDAAVLDFEKAFAGEDIERLRSLVFRTTSENLDPDNRRATIEAFNARISAYDSNRDRLQRLSLNGLVAGLAGPAVAILTGAAAAPATAIGVTLGTWLLGATLVNFKSKGTAGRVLDAVRGANSWTTSDVVLVSRLRGALAK